jgi:hypothetical protein
MYNGKDGVRSPFVKPPWNGYMFKIVCSNSYGAAPVPAGGPDHVDYGAYTGGDFFFIQFI